jgi:hypothetical protein
VIARFSAWRWESAEAEEEVESHHAGGGLRERVTMGSHCETWVLGWCLGIG